MVISVLMGGLGNQMFQYAMGYVVSKRLNTSLILELSELKRDSKRTYGLNAFDIRNKTIDHIPEKMSILSRFRKGLPSQFKTIIERKEFQFDPMIETLNGNNRLLGYWQCPAYFDAHITELRNIFTPKRLSQNSKEFLSKIQSEHSVCMHIRRGDYVSDPHTNKVHGTCSIDYYKQAFNTLLEKGIDENCPVFVFSDEPEWCEQHINFVQNVEYMPVGSDAEDLYLMSQCKHQIIANSSFSWWAAYLNDYPSKLVVAPVKWFAEEYQNTIELIPPDWIKI